MGVERRQKLLRRMGVTTVAQNLLSDMALTRPSAAWAWGSDQLLDEYAADELRRDHDPATGTFRGVLVEESRTNSLPYPHDLSQWTGFNLVSALQKEAGIDGDPNKAWTVTGAEDSGSALRSPSITIADDTARHIEHAFLRKGDSDAAGVRINFFGGTSLSISLRVNLKDGSSSFDSNDNETGVAEVEDAGNFWRVEVSAENGGTGNTSAQLILYSDRSGSGQKIVYDAGQFQKNASETSSHILGEGSSATTRAADVLEGPFSESSGTLHFVGEHKGGDGVLWQADDGTEDNRLRLEVSGGDILFVVDDGGTSQVSLNAGALASDGTYNLAARFDGSDFAISLDGATAVTAASGTVPSVTTQRFGRDSSVTHGLNWYKTANHRANKLTDSELEALTA